MTNTLYGFNAMEVQEAFVKIKEQVSCQLMLGSLTGRQCIWSCVQLAILTRIMGAISIASMLCGMHQRCAMLLICHQSSAVLHLSACAQP